MSPLRYEKSRARNRKDFLKRLPHRSRHCFPPSANRVVARGINHAHQNPLLHGEIDAINRYALSADPQWDQLRLFTTAEPCCMCQSAILWAGIPEVNFGTSIDHLRGLGWKQIRLSAIEVTRRAAFATCHIVGGVLQSQCDKLFEEAALKSRSRKPGNK